MSVKALTGFFILGTLLAIAGYDLVIYWIWGTVGTISYLAQVTGEEWPLLGPLLAFTCGALYGHFFLRLNREDREKEYAKIHGSSLAYPCLGIR